MQSNPVSIAFGLIAAVALSFAANPKSQKAFKDGLHFEELGQWKQAEQAFSEAIQFDSTDAASYLHRGKARFSLNNYQGAADDGAAVLKLEPENSAAYILRGDAYRRLAEPRKALA